MAVAGGGRILQPISGCLMTCAKSEAPVDPLDVCNERNSRDDVDTETAADLPKLRLLALPLPQLLPP